MVTFIGGKMVLQKQKKTGKNDREVTKALVIIAVLYVVLSMFHAFVTIFY